MDASVLLHISGNEDDLLFMQSVPIVEWLGARIFGVSRVGW
jgi:hypothetical protein